MINKIKPIINKLNKLETIDKVFLIFILFVLILVAVTIHLEYYKNNKIQTETILINNIQSLNDDVVLLEKANKEIERRIDRSKSLSACYKQQLDRKINKEEYSIEYCSDENNLKQFSGLN
jgi:hypothetical protein